MKKEIKFKLPKSVQDRIDAKKNGTYVEPKKVKKTSVGQSRNELMLMAKERGILNFRILNKEELRDVLTEGTPAERTKEIIANAVARWKSGWSKNKTN